MPELLLTSTGIPNTCCECGKMQKQKWYAEHDDMARSGQGKCSSCARPKPKNKPKSEPQAESVSEPSEDTSTRE